MKLRIVVPRLMVDRARVLRKVITVLSYRNLPFDVSLTMTKCMLHTPFDCSAIRKQYENAHYISTNVTILLNFK